MATTKQKFKVQFTSLPGALPTQALNDQQAAIASGYQATNEQKDALSKFIGKTCVPGTDGLWYIGIYSTDVVLRDLFVQLYNRLNASPADTTAKASVLLTLYKADAITIDSRFDITNLSVTSVSPITLDWGVDYDTYWFTVNFSGARTKIWYDYTEAKCTDTLAISVGESANKTVI